MFSLSFAYIYPFITDCFLLNYWYTNRPQVFVSWRGSFPRRQHVCSHVSFLASRLVPILSCFSHAWLSVTLWTVACQASTSMGFSRQKYWEGLPRRLLGNLPAQGLNWSLLHHLHCRQILYPLSHLGKPSIKPKYT